MGQTDGRTDGRTLDRLKTLYYAAGVIIIGRVSTRRSLTAWCGSVVVAGAAAVVAVRVALVEISDCRRTPSPTPVTEITAYMPRTTERERILLTKAIIQYQYHKTITSGRLPEGAKRMFTQ